MLHVEATMTFPNGLFLKPDAWRADTHETPCGALTPMGVHAIDGMIDLCGPIAQVYCQSFRRVVAVDSDDTTSMLFRMQDGMSGYLGTMTATGPGFSFQVFGSKGSVRLEGMTHVAGASSEERRTRLFGTCKFQPIKGEAQVWEAARLDVTRACLDAFGQAASGGPAFPIPLDQMVHGAAVTEAVVRSAATTVQKFRPNIRVTGRRVGAAHGSRQRSRPPHVLDARPSGRRLAAALGLAADISARGQDSASRRTSPFGVCIRLSHLTAAELLVQEAPSATS